MEEKQKSFGHEKEPCVTSVKENQADTDSKIGKEMTLMQLFEVTTHLAQENAKLLRPNCNDVDN